MKEVKVLGPSCARCKTLTEMVKQAAEHSLAGHRHQWCHRLAV